MDLRITFVLLLELYYSKFPISFKTSSVLSFTILFSQDGAIATDHLGIFHYILLLFYS